MDGREPLRASADSRLRCRDDHGSRGVHRAPAGDSRASRSALEDRPRDRTGLEGEAVARSLRVGSATCVREPVALRRDLRERGAAVAQSRSAHRAAGPLVRSECWALLHEYDLIADWYATQRIDRTGVPEVLALSNAIPPGALVLDVGGGNGIPLPRTLLSEGHRVVRLDTSHEMLCRLRRNCPLVRTVRGAAQFPPFRVACFDAAIAWGVLFHLPPPQQIAAIASLSHVLKAGAPF